MPRSDPLEAPDPAKLHEYSIASSLNAIYSAFLKGKDVYAAVKGWEDVAHSLSEHAAPVIGWLKDFLPHS